MPTPNDTPSLREALEYMADPANYVDEGMLKRPGGYRQVGIVAVSAHVLPWAFAKTALAQLDPAPAVRCAVNEDGLRGGVTRGPQGP